MSSNFEDEFDQIFEMEAEEFSYVVVQNGKKTLLRLGLDIEGKIAKYLEESGILDDIENLKKQVEELEKQVEELEKQVEELEKQVEELEKELDSIITTNFNEIDFSSSSDILIVKGTLDEDKQRIYC